MANVNGQPANFPIEKTSFWVSTSGTGTGTTAADPMSPTVFQAHLAQNRSKVRYVFQGGNYEFNAALTIAGFAVELEGAGTSDAVGPATRFMFGTSTNTGVAFAGGGPYTATVSGTVAAVYFDDVTAYAAAGSRGRPLKKTKNTGTPTTPGAGEYGISGATLYLGDDPAGRTVRVVTGTNNGIVIATGADEWSIRGIEVGYTNGHGLSMPATQGSGQLATSNGYLNNFWVFGCWDDNDNAAAVANNGLNIQSPCYIQARKLNIDWTDNDGISIKQLATLEASGVYVDRSGDDNVSPHYGAHLIMSNFELRNPRLVTTDGNCITLFAGASAELLNGNLKPVAAKGVYLQNGGTQYPGGKLWATDVVAAGTDWGTTGTIGWHIEGNAYAKLTRCKAIGFQNGTTGYGFYLDDGGATNIVANLVLDCCYAVNNRVNVRTNNASATNTGGMRVDAQQFSGIGATAAEISNAGAVPLGGSSTTPNTVSTDENAVVGVTVTTFEIR